MIYFVEDDLNIRDLVVYTLGSTGFTARGFADYREFREAMTELLPEMILLDIMLPGVDGIQILRRIRANPETEGIPVIMVTAKGAEFDKVKSLDLGADDYITKPFGMMELVSRVRAVLRRVARPADSTVGDEEILTIGSIDLNLPRHTVAVAGREVKLTLKEYQLLEELMSQPGILFSRNRLLDSIWGYSFHGGTRTVDVHIRTLRKKLGPAAKHIETVRGVGYKISE
ncbi:winged helix-turn-helix domain-containing protein [Mobiluncus curtisii]|uniref:Response regulator receiver domain protein n=1 Tax=Mobiluncus curtisii (strain ATCC 43063 / DSM 2711 / V125) TaxID=548479 RepID=D6ZGD1_MOBCV|nr:response regulator transcription factor [Mobiluncus curtisii]ADI67689.1 response regulator receiver domain protein [Mobiluncus curtisii ATCC 43063]MCU9987863.1 response regulator transcription factor [Mobiluncus curtisii]MCV0000853.1 response regulator transcription factor [Mobiluncus curtisii]MCV0021425.1 response regulator transcription factor [Mobiluncus curtisii]NMW46136.1 response regulator transcription factor [Mobiluncus curtisii]